MKYKVKVEPQALTDIQEITDWYNEKKTGLGKRFQTSAIKQIDSLMVHFYINEEAKNVEVLAVISTSRNPKIWKVKTKK